MTAADLAARHCKPCKKGDPPLPPKRVQAMLATLQTDWSVDAAGKSITRSCQFGNYYETIAFVNALAWIVHREDHHPDLEVGYNRCVIHFSTHSIGGLSDNDFICAARIDALLESST
jgi:4a-hydroxytetrahydrobiopterin dehydratase